MFGEINAIRVLATKYSKPQLANLVQTGQLEPQKAVMAGMMIDRIAKSAMTPPQTTVAQDVLGGQPGQMPPDQMPQQGMQGQPPQMPPQMAAHGGLMGMMPHSDGMAALHSGLHDMAGGGIVAFADGGIPGYAGGTVPDSRNDAAMRINPDEQKRRDKEWRLPVLLQELKEEQAKGNEANVAAIQREIRAIKPSLSADAGIGALIPAAQATERSPSGPAMAKAEAAKTGEQDTSSPIGRAISSALSGPAGARERYDTQQKNLQQQREKAAQLMDLGGGGFKQQTPEEQAQYEKTLKERNALMSLPPIASPAAKPAVAKPQDTTVNTLKPDGAAPATEEKPSMGPARPTAINQLGNFYGATMEEPKERNLQDVMKDQAAADKAYGVDTKKMFDDLRQDYKNSSGNLKDRADKAAGMAFMMFGAGLANAKRGRVGEAVSRSGQQALTTYMGAMDKINDNEDKLQQRLQDLSVAENQFKAGRSDKALAEVQSSKKDIQAIRLENAKLENQAMIKAAEFRVDIFKNENPAQYTLLKNIAIDSGKTPAEIFMIANGISKTGQMTLNQALEAVQKNPNYIGKSFAEQMQVAKEGIGEGGGGLPKPKTAADAEKLPQGTRYQAPDGSIRTKQ